MKIKITSDSTCDLTQALLHTHNITLAPLTVVKGNDQFKDGITITPADIFAHVASGGDLCSTAAVSIGEYEDFFHQYADSYDAVIHINLGSGFSACHQNARLAAEEFSNVYCIDSRNLSAGQGLVVLEACRLAQTENSVDAIVDSLNAYTEKVESSFLVEKLEYLVKGGRCSSAAALGANLLNLKPCIEVKDGKMAVGKKYRGSFPKCLSSYVKERLEGRTDLDPAHIFITWTQVSDDALTQVRQAVAEYGSFETVLESVAGSTISCHCGPGTLGVLFVRK